MTDAWDHLPGVIGDAWDRLPGTAGDAWARLSGAVGDAWDKLIWQSGGRPKKQWETSTGRKYRIFKNIRYLKNGKAIFVKWRRH